MRRAAPCVMRRPALPRAAMRFASSGPPARPRGPIMRSQPPNSQSPLLPYVFPRESTPALQGDPYVLPTKQRAVTGDPVPPSREKTEISHLLHAKRVDAAVEVFRSLPKSAEVYCNFISFLLDKHSTSASVAFELYDEMVLHGFMPTAKTYAALIRGCLSIMPPHAVKAEQLHQRALAQYSQPQDAVHINTAFLNVLTNQGAVNARKISKICTEIEPHSIALDARELEVLIKGYARTGRIEEAVKHYNRLVQLQRPSSSVFTHLIHMYSNAQQPDAALRLFEDMKTQGIYPTGDVILRLLQVAAKFKRPEEGSRVFSLMLHRHPLYFDALFVMIELHIRSGTVEKALELLFSSPRPLDSRNLEYLLGHIASVNLGSAGVQFALNVVNTVQSNSRVTLRRSAYDALLDVASRAGDSVVASRIWREMTVKQHPSNYAAMLECATDAPQIMQLLEAVKSEQLKMTDKLRAAVRRAKKILDDDGYVRNERDGKLVVDVPTQRKAVP